MYKSLQIHLGARVKQICTMRISLLILSLTFPLFAIALSSGDLVLSAGNVRFSTNTFLEGKSIRIYAAATNPGSEDLRGVVRFFDGKEQIQGDQPVSVLGGRDDSVFVDWKPDPGDHTIKIIIIPFENESDNPENNSVTREITVLADTDRDGVPNRDDPDDDNDGTPDKEDAFPLNRNESLDSDGDTIGNNKDEDDDNDGVKDSEDALPLNASETVDTDKDGIGNNEDKDDDGDGLSDADEISKNTDPLKADTDGDTVNDKEDAYPLDPTQARDYDRDGVSDSKDKDADNDGIPKEKDTNDTNLGPKIKITTEEKSPRRIVFPDEPVTFETTTSIDPDGKIVETVWTSEDAKSTGPKFTARFRETGVKKLVVKLTDDKGESRELAFKVYVISPSLPWILTGIIFIILILAIYFFFSYSKRRVSRFEKAHAALDMVLRILPKKPKK